MGSKIVTSSALTRGSIWIAAALLLLLLLFMTGRWLRQSSGSPPARSYDVNKLAEWTPLGGTWADIDGAIENSSEQRGAKLMNGSSQWKNYSVEADVQLLGRNGDAGFIVRGRDE